MPPNYAVFAYVRGPTLGPCRFLVNGTARDFTRDSRIAGAFLPGVASLSQFVVLGVADEQQIAMSRSVGEVMFSRR
jgi:hypothetical protein